jgi:hypothetical protein
MAPFGGTDGSGGAAFRGRSARVRGPEPACEAINSVPLHRTTDNSPE